MDAPTVHLPWAMPPSGQVSMECEWCHRLINRPALPCSIEPVARLLSMPTAPGQGDRCKFELTTRCPEDEDERFAADQT